MRSDIIENDQLKHIKLQYIRLKRHSDGASKRKDPISFLDLSHVLRIWTDMKKIVDSITENNKENIRFENSVNLRSLKKILKGSDYYSINFTNKMEGDNFVFGKLLWINRVLNKNEIDKMSKLKPPNFPLTIQTKLNFNEWLGSTIIKVPSNEQHNSSIDISRETLIRRVANILGSSHPIGTDFQEENEGDFDIYIRNLHRMKISNGIPITYYLLLEIANEILKALRNIFITAPSSEKYKRKIFRKISFKNFIKFFIPIVLVNEINMSTSMYHK